jgi:hypothetical protein
MLFAISLQPIPSLSSIPMSLCGGNAEAGGTLRVDSDSAGRYPVFGDSRWPPAAKAAGYAVTRRESIAIFPVAISTVGNSFISFTGSGGAVQGRK